MLMKSYDLAIFISKVSPSDAPHPGIRWTDNFDRKPFLPMTLVSEYDLGSPWFFRKGSFKRNSISRCHHELPCNHKEMKNFLNLGVISMSFHKQEASRNTIQSDVGLSMVWLSQSSHFNQQQKSQSRQDLPGCAVFLNDYQARSYLFYPSSWGSFGVIVERDYQSCRIHWPMMLRMM